MSTRLSSGMAGTVFLLAIEQQPHAEPLVLFFEGRALGLPLWDDGRHGDGLAGDGVWGLVVSLGAVGSAERLVFELGPENGAAPRLLWPYLNVR
jgi:hypothetical protein